MTIIDRRRSLSNIASRANRVSVVVAAAAAVTVLVFPRYARVVCEKNRGFYRNARERAGSNRWRKNVIFRRRGKRQRRRRGGVNPGRGSTQPKKGKRRNARISRFCGGAAYVLWRRDDFKIPKRNELG